MPITYQHGQVAQERPTQRQPVQDVARGAASRGALPPGARSRPPAPPGLSGPAAALDAGEWRPGDLLPPERELAERYGCSLITVRRALDELSREGRLERTRGRGTFVLPPRIERDFGGTLSFTEEMQTAASTRRRGSSRPGPESAGEHVAAALGIEPGSPTLYVERLRLAGGKPLLLEQVHLPAERFPGLLASDLEHGSLYDLLTDRYGHPDRARPRGARARPPACARGRACSASRRGRRPC